MRIGILTMYYRRNYGGILQSYALYKYLQSLNYDVTIIDYRENTSVFSYHPFAIIHTLFHTLFRYLPNKREGRRAEVATGPVSLETKSAFNLFKHKYLKYSKPVTRKTIGTLVQNFDVVIIGSDQVWSSLKYNRLVYFGDFGCIYSGKLISYAACSIYSKAPFYQARKIRQLLSRFTAISVRDETTMTFANSLVGDNVKISITSDPTLLVDINDFPRGERMFDNYIFVYILGTEIIGGHKKVIDLLKKEHGELKTIAVVIPDVSLEAVKFADIRLDNVSPQEWISLIANATAVYTDSFHGCLFALKNHKPFVAYYNQDNRSSRLLDLKRRLNLRSIISSSDSLTTSIVSNYAQVDASIYELSKSSRIFLNEAINQDI